MKKNDIFETEIMDMTTEGSGVCRVDNMAVFVPHTAVGDRIRVRIVKVLKSYAFGIVEELLEPSADRIVPACGLSQCGGCLFQHITYDAELRVKEKAVQDAFIRLGKLSPEFLPILGAESRTRYRNKAQYPFALDKTGQPEKSSGDFGEGLFAAAGIVWENCRYSAGVCAAQFDFSIQ